MKRKKFYITNAIPYVNGKPHVGHALEFVQTNTIARYNRFLHKSVLTLCGGDENALKNVQAAEEAGKPIQEFVDQNEKYFYKLTKKLNAKFDVWQKGSNKKTHFPSSQNLWRLCEKAGDIYKKKYKGLYCVGCETFYTLDELNKNRECFEHLGKKLQEISEENYFFRLSKYQNKLFQLIKEDKIKITPEKRKNETLAFIKQGLKDISISRSNERAKNWGVPVPRDKTQRLYVWLDALNIYQSGIGFGWDEKTYKKWWPADVHVIGKGILRFHAVYWPAFLLSAKLALPKAIFVHDYFTVNGQKMSKTLGNIYDPSPLLDKHGSDPFRYYCLAKISPFLDGDFSEEKFYAAYNSDLANGIGNLVARVTKLSEGLRFEKTSKLSFSSKVSSNLNKYRFDLALKYLWEQIKIADTLINKTEVWKLKGANKEKVLKEQVSIIRQIAYDLQPFLPETADEIQKRFQGETIKVGKLLFPRI